MLELKISLWNSDLTKALKAFTAVSTEAKAMAVRIPACQSPKKPNPWISSLWVYVVIISTYNGHVLIGRKLSLIRPGLQQQLLVIVNVFPTFDKFCVLIRISSVCDDFRLGFFFFFHCGCWGLFGFGFAFFFSLRWKK